MTGKYSHALGLAYRFDKAGAGSLAFTDGVTYSVAEALYISRSRASDQAIRDLHAIKKAFDGEIVIPGETDGTRDRLIMTWEQDRAYPDLRIVAGTKALKQKKPVRKPDSEPILLNFSEGGTGRG